MKTLILYASSHGTVADCAKTIAAGLGGETRLINLKSEKAPSLDGYDAVIVGGSIHAGQLQGKVKKLIRTRGHALAAKRLGLFLCSMEKSREQFESAYPEALRTAAVAEGIFGGRMDPDKMNGFFKMVVKKVSGSLEVQDTVDRTAMEEFTVSMRA